ncbi:hypothetical protein ACXJY6_10885 [Vibrio sp. RC27]
MQHQNDLRSQSEKYEAKINLLMSQYQEERTEILDKLKDLHETLTQEYRDSLNELMQLSKDADQQLISAESLIVKFQHRLTMLETSFNELEQSVKTLSEQLLP